MFSVSVLLAVIASALAGCGASQSDSGQVLSVVRRYLSAVAGGNGPEACASLSDAAKLRLRREVKAVEPNTYKPTTLSCPQEIVGVHAILGGSLAQLHDAVFGAPRLSGDAATLHVLTGSHAFDVLLSKTSDGWRIDGLAHQNATSTVGGPTELSIQPPASVTKAGGTRLAEFDLGRAVANQSGCLACHRIGEAGNRGPGPDLTYVGSSLSAARIDRAITDPTEPMPSFKHLPPAKLRALVTFLSLLQH
jgi:mono/diheme cytochrome c family protein